MREKLKVIIMCSLFSSMSFTVCVAVDGSESIIGPVKKEGLTNGLSECLIPVNQGHGEYQGLYFISNGDQSIAWMNLKGEDVKLQLINSTKPPKIKKGKFTQDFQGNGLDVQFKYVVTEVWDEDGRRGFAFNSHITIIDHGKILEKTDKAGACML